MSNSTAAAPLPIPTTLTQANGWQVPTYTIRSWRGREHPFCVVIPVINEGKRIASLLTRMGDLGIDKIADIIIIDGGSTDGSLNAEVVNRVTRGVIVKTGPGRLSAQLRCAYAFSLENGYEGIITIDGNNKDEPDTIPLFIDAMKSGVAFAQASRFISGGRAENTPLSRNFAIRCLHAPLLSLASGFHWTDTTQGYRAYTRALLMDPRLGVFRDIHNTYELLAHLSYAAPRLGYVCKEIPTVRRYPPGEVPTKISSFRGNAKVFAILVKACLGAYTPKG